MSDELHHVLEELFTDLFQCPQPADAAPLLRALATLAATSSLAKKRLGQALVADSAVHNEGRVTRLQRIAESFLYNEASAIETLTLFAVLAHGNVANQQRIARHVKGVCVSIPQPSSLSQQPLTLLVLSVPNSLQAQYKEWNTRQRELVSRRVPAGSPPSLDGVPAACYCDECLGAPQLLATWVSHYEDLSRWSLRGDRSEEIASARRLGSEEFLQQTLSAVHVVRQYRCVIDDEKEKDCEPVVAGVDGVLWYFATDVNGPSSVVPDPRRYACAIQIDPSIVGIVRKKSSASDGLVQQCDDSVGRQTVKASLEQVQLLENRVELPYCPSPHDQNSVRCGVTPWLPTIAQIFNTASAMSNSAVTAAWLHSRVSETLDIPAWERLIFLSIVSFLESGTLLDVPVIQKMFQLGSEACTSSDLTGQQTETEPCHVRVMTGFDGQILEVVATTSEGDEFAAHTPIADLLACAHSKTISLLSISDKSLAEVVQHCLLCRHEGCDPDGCDDVRSSIHLTYRQRRRIPVETADSPLEEEAVCCNDSRPAHSRGLSSIAESQLRALNLVLSSEKEASVLDVSNRVCRFVHECNQRMAKLASASDRTESQRKAGRERCRVCRDLLIEAAKRMKLGIGSEATATLASVAKIRLQRVISRVLQLNESADEWEKPDERVQRLHLNRLVWASGVPDPEFYIDSEARAKTNHATQRRLNRLLVKRTRQQRTLQS